MSLPEAASLYLQSILADKLRPYTIELTSDGRLRGAWGELVLAGLSDLRPGDEVAEHAPWLHGIDLSRPGVLPDVEIGGDVLDIHVLPGEAGAFVVFLPVTSLEARRDLQQTANEVRLLNHQQQRLLDELAEANEEVEKRRQETERANKVKTQFIAGMSHEFRTPLTSVLGYTDLIQEQTRDDQELSAYAAAIGRAARHLLSMVDNVLDQARLEDESVIVHIAPVDLRQVVDDLAAIVAPLAANKVLGFGAFVTNDVPRHVMSDVVRLRQVLLNVLGNAIKFTAEGDVGLEIDWRDGELLAKVSDTGPGIAADEQERIFEAFQRGSKSEGTLGAGLGLNITRRILGLLGGEISVDSETGKGSVFSIRVPAPTTVYEEPPQAPVRRRSKEATNQRILVAEDDIDIVELVQIILGRAGYQLSIAASGDEAVTRALSDQPDIVLMDVNMPGLDGLSATRVLRERGFDAPIVALTASLSTRDRSKAYDAGCDGYLIKPISAPELLSAIERYLETV